MASALSAQMSGQMPGCPAAIRVMSRKPPAASCSRAPCSSPRSAASVHEGGRRQVGHVGHHGHQARRARPGSRATTSAPSSARTARDPGVGVGVGGRRRGQHPGGPDEQLGGGALDARPAREPAMGWPPTKRGRSTAATSGPLTLPTSVTTASGFQPVGRQDVRDDRRRPRGPGWPPPPGRRSRSSPSASRAPSATARAAVPGVGVGAGHVPAPGAQGHAHRAADQAGADDHGPPDRPDAGGGPAADGSVGEVVTESLGALEVDVVDLVPRAVGGDVQHDPDAAGTEPTMASSRAQISGTAPRPMVRAAVAGKIDTMSSVAVNRMRDDVVLDQAVAVHDRGSAGPPPAR